MGFTNLDLPTNEIESGLQEALHVVDVEMRALEDQHAQRLAAGEAAATLDREIAEAGLSRIVSFFLDHGIESQPVYRLLTAIAAVSAGASPPPMLLPTKTHHRRPGAPAIEVAKGRLAAIMAYRQQSGLSRKAASAWVARNLPTKLRQRLGANSPAAVDHWLLKWGGTRGARSGPGRESYLAMVALLEQQIPDEHGLKRAIGALAKSLPS
jgi:hypothetical protein